MIPIGKRLIAEMLGSLLLAATVIGSGIMAERLAGGNAAIALLANTAATIAALAVLIALFAPVSGAHFNPAITLVAALRGKLDAANAGLYIVAQVVGCCLGTLLAHAMFELPLIQFSTQIRSGPSQWLSEFVATAGLVCVVLGAKHTRQMPWMVAGWIGAAYWFTASTSFANPAVTVARSLTDTFAGVRPVDGAFFLAAQLLGAAAALGLAAFLFVKAPRLHASGVAGMKAAAPGMKRTRADRVDRASTAQASSSEL